MGGFVVVVTFTIKAEYRADFSAAMLANAADSLALERGCRVFEVCEGKDGSQIFLYEVYDDKAAFDAHLATDHFRMFDKTVAAWVSDKRVMTYNRLELPASSRVVGRPN
jgi:quinol monooxygenase YgiN